MLFSIHLTFCFLAGGIGGSSFMLWSSSSAYKYGHNLYLLYTQHFFSSFSVVLRILNPRIWLANFAHYSVFDFPIWNIPFNTELNNNANNITFVPKMSSTCIPEMSWMASSQIQHKTIEKKNKHVQYMYLLARLVLSVLRKFVNLVSSTYLPRAQCFPKQTPWLVNTSNIDISYYQTDTSGS